MSRPELWQGGGGHTARRGGCDAVTQVNARRLGEAEGHPGVSTRRKSGSQKAVWIQLGKVLGLERPPQEWFQGQWQT